MTNQSSGLRQRRLCTRGRGPSMPGIPAEPCPEPLPSLAPSPTPSSSRCPRRARPWARGRRAGKGVCGWRPRCTACTRPADRERDTRSLPSPFPIPGNPNPWESQTLGIPNPGIPIHPSPRGLSVRAVGSSVQHTKSSSSRI